MAAPLILLAYAASRRMASKRVAEDQKREREEAAQAAKPRYSGYLGDTFVTGVFTDSPEFSNLDATHFQTNASSAPVKLEKQFKSEPVYWDTKNKTQISADMYNQMSQQKTVIPGYSVGSELGYLNINQPPKMGDPVDVSHIKRIGNTTPSGVDYIPAELMKSVFDEDDEGPATYLWNGMPSENLTELEQKRMKSTGPERYQQVTGIKSNGETFVAIPKLDRPEDKTVNFFYDGVAYGKGVEGYEKAEAAAKKDPVDVRKPILQFDGSKMEVAVSAPEKPDEKDPIEVTKFRVFNPETEETKYFDSRGEGRKYAKSIGLTNEDVEQVKGPIVDGEIKVGETTFYESPKEGTEQPDQYIEVQLSNGNIVKESDIPEAERPAFAKGSLQQRTVKVYDDGTEQRTTLGFPANSAKNINKQASAIESGTFQGITLPFPTDNNPEYVAKIGFSTEAKAGSIIDQMAAVVQSVARLEPGALDAIQQKKPEEYTAFLGNVANKVLEQYVKDTTTDQFGNRRNNPVEVANVVNDYAFKRFSGLKNLPQMTKALQSIFDEHVEARRQRTYTASSQNGQTGLVAESVFPMPDPDNPDQTIDARVIMGVSVPGKYNQVVAALKQVHGLTDDEIASFARKKRGADGLPLTNMVDGELITLTEDDQPELDMIQTLLSKPFYWKDTTGRQMQGSYFDIFLHEITPEGNRFDTFAVSAPDRSAISTLFMDAVRDNPEQGIKVIQNLTNVGNTMGRRMLEKKYGNDVGAVQKVIQGAAAEAGSAQQAFSTLNNMRATYFMPDGSPLDLTSFAGDFVLGADGILYLMEKGSQFLQQGFAGVLGGQSQIVRPEDVGSVAAQVLQGMRGMVMSPEEAEAAKRGTAEENEAARQSNMELFQSIAADLVSDGFETVRINNVDRRVPKKLLAARRFYKYLAAYQMAAAIQGGTGGRTISDQDVENMLNSFNFTAKTTPEAELATLDAAMGMMDRIRKVKGAIGGSSTAARYAALKYEELETYADGETVVNAYDDILGASMLLKEEGAGNRRSVAPAGSSAADGVTVREFNAWLSSVGVVGLPDNATAEDIKNHPRYSEYTGGSSTT